MEPGLPYGKVFPKEEKVFSIFEPYTNWLTKGIVKNKVELGNVLFIIKDYDQFIVNYKVLNNQRDAY